VHVREPPADARGPVEPDRGFLRPRGSTGQLPLRWEARMVHIRKLLARLGLREKPSWETFTKTGVLFRQCIRTHRLQYRDCATHRWLEVETREHLAQLIQDSQTISPGSPPWVQQYEFASTAGRLSLFGIGTETPTTALPPGARERGEGADAGRNPDKT